MIDPTTTSGSITQDDKMMAMLACILGILTSWVGPLIIFLLKKDQSKFVAFYAMQMLILQIAVIILYMASAFTFLVSGGIGFIVSVVFGIIAALAANRGEWYEVPLAGKFAKQQVGITA